MPSSQSKTGYAQKWIGGRFRQRINAAPYLIDPVSHPTQPHTMVVPLWKQRANDYVLYVTGRTARYYEDVELPDVLRCQLGLIHAMQDKPAEDKDPIGGGLATLLIRKHGQLDLPVGIWMFPSWYLLVLENNVLRDLVSPQQSV